MTEPELEPTGRTPATPDAEGPGDSVDPTEAGLETGTDPGATDTDAVDSDATAAAAAGDAVAEPNDETAVFAPTGSRRRSWSSSRSRSRRSCCTDCSAAAAAS
jgi:hypothetical protein